VIATIDGRSVPGDSSRLISDGVDCGHDQHNGPPPDLILLKGAAGVLDDEDEVCEQMYGFLPCSYSIAGHLFLILVYEYLLFQGESCVASGSEQIFKMLGPGIFGASAFHVLGALPEALILLGIHLHVLFLHNLSSIPFIAVFLFFDGRICALSNCFSKKQQMGFG